MPLKFTSNNAIGVWLIIVLVKSLINVFNMPEFLISAIQSHVSLKGNETLNHDQNNSVLVNLV